MYVSLFIKKFKEIILRQNDFFEKFNHIESSRKIIELKTCSWFR